MNPIPRTSILTLAVLVGALLACGAALAANYHTGSDLHCSDCHVMHGSYNGTTYNGGSGIDNLLKGSANAMCLACHDGTDTAAPDIVASGTAASPNNTISTAYTDKYGGSGGFFQSDTTTVVSPVAHDLFATSALTAIHGTWTSGSSGMTCADCHDPHGTTNYRNLLSDPDGDTTDALITIDSDVYLNATTPITSYYAAGNVGFNEPNDIVAWCTGCHTNTASDTASPWAKHPMDDNAEIADLSSTLQTHWTTGTGNGFDTDVDDATSGIPRVRFAQTGTSFALVTTVGTANEVMCLTCHKAHGSKYDSTTVWPHYVDDNADQTSACDQCHDKGA